MIYLSLFGNNKHDKINSEVKVDARHKKQTVYFFLFFFRIENLAKVFISFQSCAAIQQEWNTARMVSGGKWILLNNDWEQRSSGLL